MHNPYQLAGHAVKLNRPICRCARKGVPVGNMSASAIAVQEGQKGATMVQIRDEQNNPPNVLKMTACADGVNAIDKAAVKDLKFVGITNHRYSAFKRMMDIILALAALVMIAAPMLIISMMVYIDDPGNVIFAQYRVGMGGRRFKLYKLRTMRQDTPRYMPSNEVDDPDRYITRIGHILRRFSIDELPQLFNVLKGDMSLIGPRPPLPREVVLYTPAQMERLMVKGGLSCICQCEGRSDMAFDEWVESDVRYIRTRSLGLDCKLFFSTIAVVLKRKGAR